MSIENYIICRKHYTIEEKLVKGRFILATQVSSPDDDDDDDEG